MFHKKKVAIKRSHQKKNGKVHEKEMEVTKMESKTTELETVQNPQPAVMPNERKPVMVRAIRVTSQLMEAARAYKKASGKSFYTLGFEAVTERLVKEGYLKETGSEQ
jgi:hypothetical protein